MDLGYEYIGIADHTKFLRIEHGLDEEQLLERNREIDALNEKLRQDRKKFYHSQRLRGQYHERRQYRHHR